MPRTEYLLLDIYQSAFGWALSMILTNPHRAGRPSDERDAAIEDAWLRSTYPTASSQSQIMPATETQHSNHADWALIQISWVTAYWIGLYEAVCQGQVDLWQDAHARGREFAAGLGQSGEIAPARSIAALKLVVGNAPFKKTTHTVPARDATIHVSVVGVAQPEPHSAGLR